MTLAKHKFLSTYSRKNEWYIEPEKIIQKAKSYKDIIEKSKFVYFLICDGQIVYVGMSDRVQKRLQDHTKDKTFDRVFWIRVNDRDQKYIEAYYIATLKPKYNRFIPIHPLLVGALERSEV